MFPESLMQKMQNHLLDVKKIHNQDLIDGYGEVFFPNALAKKYPNAPKEWKWQYVFPATKRCVDPHTGVIRRHHWYDTNFRRAIRQSVHSYRINKQVGVHTQRHSFSTQLL